MQANGADMLRLACCYAVDRGVPIIAPIHDAVLIEGPGHDIADIAREMQRCMVDASRAVLGGPTVRVDISKPLTFPTDTSTAAMVARSFGTRPCGCWRSTNGKAHEQREPICRPERTAHLW